MLHQQLPQLLRQDVVSRQCDGAKSDEDSVCRGKVVSRW